MFFNLNKIRNPKILFPFFMALIMACVMSGVLVLINLGFVENFFFIWMRSYLIAFCVALPTVYAVVPIVQKIVKAICS